MSRTRRLLRLPVLLAAALLVFAFVALLTAAAVAYKTVHNGLATPPRSDPAAAYAWDGIQVLEHHLAKGTDR